MLEVTDPAPRSRDDPHVSEALVYNKSSVKNDSCIAGEMADDAVSVCCVVYTHVEPCDLRPIVACLRRVWLSA